MPLNTVIITASTGDAPGQCDNLTEGEKFLVFLNTADDGRFVQSYKPDSGEDTFVHEVLVLCGVTTSYPTGTCALTTHSLLCVCGRMNLFSLCFVSRRMNLDLLVIENRTTDC